MCLYSRDIFSQKALEINDFINNVESSSEIARSAKYTELNNKEYRLFNKSFLPDFSLNFSLPSYNRSISEVMQPDGSYAFRESNSANSKVSLSLTQKIPFTGGKITISNSLNRLDLFGDDQRSTSYSASWLGINFSQSLTFFNEMKWENKIQQAKYNYNNLINRQKRIDIKKAAVRHYFELAKIKKQAVLIDAEWISASKYKKIVKDLISAGRIMAYDSIDVELRLLDIQRNQVFLKKGEALKIKSINSFFNSEIIRDSDQLPVPGLNFEVQSPDAYIESYLLVHQIVAANSLTGLDKNIRQLQSMKYYSANLSLGVGFNNATDQYQDIFKDPNQSQNFSISLSLPLLDFGKRKTEFQISKTKYEIEALNLELDKRNTIERINLTVQEIRDLYEALKIEKSRSALLQNKLKLMEKLLFAQKVLYAEYSDAERLSYDANIEIMNITEQIYNKVTDLEQITLTDIIKYEN